MGTHVPKKCTCPYENCIFFVRERLQKLFLHNNHTITAGDAFAVIEPNTTFFYKAANWYREHCQCRTNNYQKSIKSPH